MSGKSRFTGKKAASSKSLLAPKQTKSGTKKTTGRWKETEEERLAREGNHYIDPNITISKKYKLLAFADMSPTSFVDTNKI